MSGKSPKTNKSTAEFLRERPFAWSFFQAARRLECLCAKGKVKKPRIGQSQRPNEDPVRFGQKPTLAFPPSEIAELKDANLSRPEKILVHFLGLLGCNGPMPLAITEYVYHRIIHNNDETLARFLDLFHHRMISFFYRAWAINQQTVSYDREEDDYFALYFRSFIGQHHASWRKNNEIPNAAKLFYSGRLIHFTRNPEGLRAILEDYFDVPVHIEEFIGHWVKIPERDQCQVGINADGAVVGMNLFVGERFWDCQHKFRVVFGPLSLSEYVRMLPGNSGFKHLVEWVRNYAEINLEWDFQLRLKKEDVPGLALGGGNRIGYTSWFRDKPFLQNPEDCVIIKCERKTGVKRVQSPS